MYGPIGEQFTATMGTKPLRKGDVIPLDYEPEKALRVVCLDGLTAMGSQWYRFEVVAHE